MPRKSMASTKQAKGRYKSEKVKRFLVEFYPTEAKIWEHLQEQPNKAGYIKGLIAADLERGSSAED